MRASAAWIVAVVMGLVGAQLALASGAEAQRFDPRGRPIFGQVRLNEGFQPDPHLLQGRMGGPVPAAQVNSGCRGYVSEQPSHVIVSNSGFRNLRFVVSGSSDNTLLVMLPNGQVLCDDDGGESMNALVQTSVPRGRIAIWVGSYSNTNTGTPYTLGLTEYPNVTASTIAGGGSAVPIGPGPGPSTPVRPPAGLATNAPPRFGSANLQSGFTPDPHVLAGTASGSLRGGDIDASCRGYYEPQPSHILNSSTGFGHLRFIVNGTSDTTLLVMLPDGRILCDDDGGSGVNPLLTTAAPPGPIRVWVGTYSQGRTAPYNIGFSELPQMTTANVPSPNGGVVGPGPGPGPGPQEPDEIVPMTPSIPVTLVGPGMSGNTVAVWNPSGGPATHVRMRGRNLMAGDTTVGSVPSSMNDPVVTVEQRRDGRLLVRMDQPPAGRGDQGQQSLLLVRWQGRPVVAEQWSGTAMQRGPRWSR
ncbi:MAG: hypothetical protein AB7S26_05240 [Sandaracinaceae bacterium]